MSVIIACEKDDICVDESADTPHLVIEFIDIAPPNDLKPVTNLLIVGVGNPVSYGLESTRSSVTVPLKIADLTTSFRFIKDFAVDDNGTPDDDSDDIFSGNEDVIEINYTNEVIYISKACGFKNIFNDVTVNFLADADNWIQNIEVITNTIENENETHVYIYH